MSTPIFTRLDLGRDPTNARRWLFDEFAPALTAAGLQVDSVMTDGIAFKRRRLPFWALVLGLITLPLGLIFLVFVRREERLTLELQSEPEGVVLNVAGEGSSEIQRLFLRLHQDGVALPGVPSPTTAA